MPNYNDHEIKRQLDAGQSVREVVAASKGSDLLEVFCRHPVTFAAIAREEEAALRVKLRSMATDRGKPWESPLPERSSYASRSWDFKTGINATPVELLGVVRAELALALVCTYHFPQDHNDATIVEKLFGEGLTAEKVGTLDKFTRLWAALRRTSSHKGWDEQSKAGRIAVESYIMQLVEDSPILWADSLHLILARAGELGELVEIITITLAPRSPEVEAALQFVADHSESLELRDHARGLLLMAKSIDQPKPATVNRMIDMLARWAGAGVLFPHPCPRLRPHGWPLTMRRRSYAPAFGPAFSSSKSTSGRKVLRTREDLSAGCSPSWLSPSAFGGRSQPLWGGLGFAPNHALPSIIGPLTAREERAHGPDIAFIMHATLHGSLAMDYAEFVQVKKPKQYRGKWQESWTIDVVQLNNLLNTSQSAAYWLIDWEGRVCAVPAKYIKAWMPGKAGDTFTLGFNSVRSAAVPAEQFLTDLLVGSWLGNSQPTAMKIARGEVPGLVPRNLVEVSVLLHGDQ